MKKWIITGSVVVMLAGLAILVRWWLPPLLTFVGANSDLIQGVTDLVQLLLWIGVAAMAGLGLWRDRRKTSKMQEIPKHRRIDATIPGQATIGERIDHRHTAASLGSEVESHRPHHRTDDTNQAVTGKNAQPSPLSKESDDKGGTVSIDNQQRIFSEGGTRIEGDVIIGDATVNKAEFYGPVTGPIHTGSGDIHIGPTTQTPPPSMIPSLPTQSVFGRDDALTEEALRCIKEQAIAVLPPPTPDPFADHSIQHSERVIEKLDQLLSFATRPLSDNEKLVLQASAYLHDVGMSYLNYRELVDSPFLTKKYARQQLENPTEQFRVELLFYHHPELSAEMIPGSIQLPAIYPSLGLQDIDTTVVEDIVTVCRVHHNANLADVPLGGESGVRLQFLVALLSLANELDVDYRLFGMEHLKTLEISIEARLRWWLHYYVQRIDIDQGRIKIHYDVPSEKYETPVKKLVSVPAFLTHRAMLDILWSNGVQTYWLPASVLHSDKVESMPEPLFKAMYEKARRLAEPRLHLGEFKPASLMMISPFYFTGVRSPLEFDWRMDRKTARYEISVFSSLTSARDVFAKRNEIWTASCEHPPVAYSGSALEPGCRYTWRLESVGDQGRSLLAEGVFWLIDDPELDRYVQTVSLDEADENIRAAVLGAAYTRAGLYEDAIAQYGSILKRNEATPENLMVYQAHIALREIYTEMAWELDTLDSLWPHVSEPLTDKAAWHARQLK